MGEEGVWGVGGGIVEGRGRGEIGEGVHCRIG